MATITDAVVRVRETGQGIRADCFGNNAAIECPKCYYPVLLIARPDQRGSAANNPGICRHCGCRVWVLDDTTPNALLLVNVAIGD
jgi:hypothetical protein